MYAGVWLTAGWTVDAWAFAGLWVRVTPPTEGATAEGPSYCLGAVTVVFLLVMPDDD
jgi:hypothetical protein